jgi:hypothetical protein
MGEGEIKAIKGMSASGGVLPGGHETNTCLTPMLGLVLATLRHKARALLACG